MQPMLFTLVRLQTIRSARLVGNPRLLPGMLPLPAVYLRIFGVTKDSAGTPLGSCNVQLFETLTDRYVGDTTSDATTGEYEFRSASLSTAYFAVAYLPGSPDRAGTTLNTLLGS